MNILDNPSTEEETVPCNCPANCAETKFKIHVDAFIENACDHIEIDEAAREALIASLR